MNISQVDISIIIPIYNEAENLPELVARNLSIIQSLQMQGEIILVNDASSDDSEQVLRELQHHHPQLKVILLRRNYGQSAAMTAGFHHAKGRIVVSMDGDLQNDPADIPRLIDKLNEGFDVVCGWRKARQDTYMKRVLPSKIANWLIGKLTGVRLHDYGCSLKIYKQAFIKDLVLYGELHRFIPVLLSLQGAKITELPVNHQARKHGVSKYGIGRTPRVMLDLILMYYFQRFATRPLHFFGKTGIYMGGFGFLIELYLLIVKFGLGEDIGSRPLLMVGFMMIISGFLFIGIGILAELMVRIYHEASDEHVYKVREIVGPN